MKKILIVEDDIWISQSLRLYLENSWYDVVLYYEWNWALDFISKVKPDLIIMDINLPWIDWIELTKKYRENWTLPIIMLTARSSELDRIRWLEIWADDYIAKPFSPRELLARISTILRRVGIENINEDNFSKIKKNENELKVLDIVLNISKKTVNKWELKITLTSNEFEILKKLIDSEWSIVSRETIMRDIIWYDNYLYDRTIDTHIKNLRKKLDAKDLIITVRWEWYRINI